ncbi:MAG TPA: hypothetical protein VIX17_08275 [Pyrinomonadaceae bacterium]
MIKMILVVLTISMTLVLGAQASWPAHGKQYIQARTVAPALVTVATSAKADVAVLNSRWYGRPADIELSVPCFRAMNDTPDEIDRYQMHCRKRAERANESPSYGDGVGHHEDSGNNRNSEVNEYAYEIRVQNNGAKTIKGIAWDYIFADPQTNEDLARHTFFNETQIRPGEARTLTATSIKPPSRVITVQMLLNNSSGSYKEEIKVKRIIYADGSTWQLELN